MAVESFQARLAMLEEAAKDSSAVRERGIRNERELIELRAELVNDLKDLRREVGEVRDEVRSMYRAFVTASITFVFAAAGIITTLIELFK